jgi:hypothetical protein
MYLGVMLASWGGLLLYWTWASLGFSILMFGLIARARHEDRVLNDEFGEAWRDCTARVPGWVPAPAAASDHLTDRRGRCSSQRLMSANPLHVGGPDKSRFSRPDGRCSTSLSSRDLGRRLRLPAAPMCPRVRSPC